MGDDDAAVSLGKAQQSENKRNICSRTLMEHSVVMTAYFRQLTGDIRRDLILAFSPSRIICSSAGKGALSLLTGGIYCFMKSAYHCVPNNSDFLALLVPVVHL